MQSTLQETRPISAFRWYALLAAVGTGAAFGWLAAIPSDPKNAWLWGLSRFRWLLLLPLAVLAASFLAGFLLKPANARRLQKVFARSAEKLASPGSQAGAIATALAGLIVSLYLTIYVVTLPGEKDGTVWLRLLPLFSWGVWMSLQTVVFFGLHALKTRPDAWERHPLYAWRNLFGAVLIFGVAWFARGFALEQYATIDESTWLRGGSQFYIAMQEGDYDRTYLIGHPGVTLMWAKYAGLAAFLSPPEDLDYGNLTANQLDYLLLRQGSSRIEVLAAARFFIALANALAVSLIFVYAARLTSSGPAFIGALLLALGPFHAAHTRLLAMDGTLASFMGLSLVAFFSFLRSGRKRDLFVSGVAAGISWLTKSPGFFLIPTLGLVSAVWRAGSLGRTELRTRWRQEGAALGIVLLAWGLTGLLVFSALFPAMWVSPLATLEKIFATALGYASVGHQGLVYWNGRVIADGQIRDFFFYPATFLWRTTPTVLVGLIAAAAGLFRPTRLRGMDRQAVMGLLGSALLIWLIMNLGTKRFDRYFLPFYPLLDLAAGAGLAALVAVFSGKARWLGYALLAGLIGLQAGQLISVHPYYLSYYNPLLGGPARAPEVMMIGWGEGLDQAGRYLSAKPEAADLEVVAWYNQGPFSYFFSGASQHISINTPPSPARLAEILQADYIVVYINQWQRNAPADLLAALSGRQPEHTVWIDGLEYVRIYRMNP